MAKIYPRDRYPSGRVAEGDTIRALMEQKGMSAVEANQAITGKLSGARLRAFGLTQDDIGQLAVASILHVSAERAK